jgi:hypothetical protein
MASAMERYYGNRIFERLEWVFNCFALKAALRL